MGDELDDHLSQGLPKRRRALGFLKIAYECGIHGLVNRSITDKLLAESGHTFHIGTDDPQMRRIASWLLTHYPEAVEELTLRCWKRNGREDVKLVGLLIANTEGDAWTRFLSLLRSREPMEVILDISEEIKRSGRDIPSAQFLVEWSGKSRIHHQAVLLIASLEMRSDLRAVVESAPSGGELFERIRARALGE
jgi:hypothetical protein